MNFSCVMAASHTSPEYGNIAKLNPKKVMSTVEIIEEATVLMRVSDMSVRKERSKDPKLELKFRFCESTRMLLSPGLFLPTFRSGASLRSKRSEKMPELLCKIFLAHKSHRFQLILIENSKS